jgi:ABC-type multidrug transport system ATPase subunit
MLILDEPASSIDPLSVRTIYRVLREAADKGCAVLLSTHQLDDVSYYCDEVSVLDGGVLATHLTLEAFRNSYLAHVSHVARAKDALQQAGITVQEVQGSQLRVEVPQRRQLGRVAYVLARARVALFDLRPYRLDLAALLERYRQERDAEMLEGTPQNEPKDAQKEPPKDSA